MKRQIERIVSALVLVGAWSCLAGTTTVGGRTWTYDVSNGKATVTEVSPASGEITIPSSLGGYTVTGIGYGAFMDCSGMTSVTIPTSVTSVGAWAFANCSGLTSVTIPSSVRGIGIGAFNNCSGLKSVTISNGVTSIGDYAFTRCSGLASLRLPPSVTSIGSDAFALCSELISVTMPACVTKLSATFPDAYKKIKEVIVCDGVASIGEWTFANCRDLTSVTIPSSVTSIGGYAFYHCVGLTSVTIPSSVTSIGSHAFEYCSGLTSVTIPSSVTSIGNYAFYYCSGLTSVTIPLRVTSIGKGVFRDCSGLTSVVIPSRVTSIGDEAFSYCRRLTSVTIPSCVTSIGDDAFYDCSGLKSFMVDSANSNFSSPSGLLCSKDGKTLIVGVNGAVTIPPGVTSIGDYAFDSRSGLTSVTIPSSVTSIGSSAFSGCSGLTSVTIPLSVTSIGSSAFSGCSGLTRVNITDLAKWCDISFSSSNANPLYYVEHLFLNGEEVEDLVIPEGVTSIGSFAFYGCSGLKSVTIPSSVTSIGSSAFSGCSGLTRVNITDLAKWCEISFAEADANPLWNAGHLYLNGMKIAKLEIPDGATCITGNAFTGGRGLTSVAVPNSVTNIGLGAFSGCAGITNMVLPFVGSKRGSVWSEDSVFGWIFGGLSYTGGAAVRQYYTEGYYSYVTFYIPESLKTVEITDETRIERAFYNCSGLKYVALSGSIESIGEYAFSDCSGLMGVGMPDSVKSIGDYAFASCKGLTSVTIPTNVITVGENAFGYCSKLTQVTFSEGVKWIDSWAFDYCRQLESVAIPSTLTHIEKNAFYECSGLKSVVCVQGDVKRVKNMLRDSGVSVDNLIFKERPPLPIFTPSSGTIFNEPLKVSITCAVENATIHYTMDGTEPTVDSPVFKKFMLSEKAEIKAVAEYDGCVSEVASAMYAKGRCEPPEISSSDQEFHFSGKDVIITCASEGAEIRYTTDGSDPTTQSRLYEGPFTIDDTTTVRAIAVGHPDYFDSEIATATFTRDWLTVANPTCNPPDGTTFYLSGQNVALSCEEGASIFYTLNGDLPTCESLRYEEPISINDTTTIRMVAVRNDYRDSEVVTVKLTRDYYKVAAPTLSVNGSVSFTGSRFTITVSRDMMSDAVLRYTLDGSDPTEGSPILAGDSIVVTDTTTVKVRAFIEDWKPSDMRAVEVTKVRTLGDALNQPDVAFETSAAYPWVADRNVTHDGEESARSGTTPHNGCSWLQMTVDQATQVKFWWKVSCEKDWDGLSFLTNGIPVAKIDGEVDWTDLAVYVPAGTVLRWEYNKDETTSDGSDCGWVDEITLLTGMPMIEADEGATVTGDAETGFVIKPSEGKTAVEVTIPQGVDAAKVTVEVSPKVASVKPNGAKVKVVSGDADITEFLNMPTADGSGVVDLTKATVKEEIVKEAMDPAKGAVIELDAANPSLTTPNTRVGLFYQLCEGVTIGGMVNGDSTIGDGKPWVPEIKVKGGNSAFYSIGVGKGE